MYFMSSHQKVDKEEESIQRAHKDLLRIYPSISETSNLEDDLSQMSPGVWSFQNTFKIAAARIIIWKTFNLEDRTLGTNVSLSNIQKANRLTGEDCVITDKGKALFKNRPKNPFTTGLPDKGIIKDQSTTTKDKDRNKSTKPTTKG